MDKWSSNTIVYVAVSVSYVFDIIDVGVHAL